METVLLVIHILVTLILIGVVLLQRSEGGALGMGGGAGGGVMSSRGAANLLTRTTAILAGVFMLTSISLAFLSGAGSESRSILDTPASETTAPATEAPKSTEPSAPVSQ